jgi:DNA-binding CsgD family transcriptional regulator/tetratricopeptide (TPR) repeat protein
MRVVVQRISSPAFIGRRTELRRVAALREVARATDTGTTVLVSGEAGVGKSRFCNEAANQAIADGWIVLRGSCDEFGAESRPFAALREMVPAVDAALRTYASEDRARPAWEAIETLARSAGPGGQRTAPPGSVAHLVADLFRRLAERRPVFVVMDDLHWADESSRILFATLARGLRPAPTVLLGAFRGGDLGRGHPLRAVLSAVHRNAAPELIDLLPFDLAASRQLVVAIAGEATDSSHDELIARSGGNAFFLEELLATPQGVLPQGVRDVVVARLDGLRPDALRVTESLALDTATSRDVLSGTVDLPPARFATALDEISDLGFLAPRSGDLSFRHALVREVVYAQIPPGRRPELHRRRAEVLEQVREHSLGEQARHWFEGGDIARAFVASLKAGDSAVNVGATPEAALHYERAMALWERLPGAEVLGALTHERLALLTLSALEGSRNWDRAIGVATFMLDGDKMSRGFQSYFWVHLSRLLWYSAGNERQAHRGSLTAIRRALDLLNEDTDPVTEIVVLAQFIQRAVLSFGLDGEALTAWRRLLELEPGTGLIPSHRWLFLTAGAVIHMAYGDERSLAFVEQLQGPANIYKHPSPAGVRLLATLGLHERNLREGIPAADGLFEAGHGPLSGFQAEAHLARSFSALGRWKEAFDRFESVRDRLGSEAFDDWPDLVWDGWGSMMARTGRIQELRRLLTLSEPWSVPCVLDETPVWTMGSWALCQVELAKNEGDPRAAFAAIDEVIDVARGHNIGYCAEPVAYALGAAADACFDVRLAANEALALADRWIGRLLECLDEGPGRVRVFDLGAFLEQARAERARIAGSDGPATWESLAANWQAMPRPYHAAYCRFRAAFALLMAPAAAERKESRERAAGHLESALATFMELGAIHLEADVKRLRQAAGLWPRSTPKSAAALQARPAGPAMTSRELEVLRLVVAGDSNGQIAIRLGISVKTASAHVSNILRKLEADNRVEAAVRATRTGLVDFTSR